jgi:hypothetical protein
MAVASSLARNAIALATSTVSMNPRGDAMRMIRFQSALSGGVNSVDCAVGMPPGHTALTRSFSFVNSMANARVSPISPCLAAQYPAE